MTDDLRKEMLGFRQVHKFDVPLGFEVGPEFMGWVMQVMASSNDLCNIAQYDGSKAGDLIWKRSKELLTSGYSQSQLNSVDTQVKPYLPALFELLKTNF